MYRVRVNKMYQIAQYKNKRGLLITITGGIVVPFYQLIIYASLAVRTTEHVRILRRFIILENIVTSKTIWYALFSIIQNIFLI